MAAKISDEQWKAARERYETEPGVGYGQIAQALDCSRNLVARRAQKEGWQKRLDVVPTANRLASDANPKLTGSADERGTQSANVYTERASNAEPARVVADAFVAPGSPSASSPAQRSAKPAGVVSDRSLCANYADELEWIERQVADRQKALMRRHETELKALSNAIYDGLRKVGQKGMGEAGRAANSLSMAMQRKHAMELEHEAARTRIELGAHYGVTGPRPCRIIVNMVPGVRIGGAAAVYGPNAVAVDGQEAS